MNDYYEEIQSIFSKLKKEYHLKDEDVELKILDTDDAIEFLGQTYFIINSKNEYAQELISTPEGKEIPEELRRKASTRAVLEAIKSINDEGKPDGIRNLMSTWFSLYLDDDRKHIIPQDFSILLLKTTFENIVARNIMRMNDIEWVDYSLLFFIEYVLRHEIGHVLHHMQHERGMTTDEYIKEQEELAKEYEEYRKYCDQPFVTYTEKLAAYYNLTDERIANETAHIDPKLLISLSCQTDNANSTSVYDKTIDALADNFSKEFNSGNYYLTNLESLKSATDEEPHKFVNHVIPVEKTNLYEFIYNMHKNFYLDRMKKEGKEESVSIDDILENYYDSDQDHPYYDYMENISLYGIVLHYDRNYVQNSKERDVDFIELCLLSDKLCELIIANEQNFYKEDGTKEFIQMCVTIQNLYIKLCKELLEDFDHAQSPEDFSKELEKFGL